MWGDEEGGWIAFGISFGLVGLAKGILFSIVDGEESFLGEKDKRAKGQRV